MQMQCNASGSVTLTVSLNDEPAVQHAVGYVTGDQFYGAKASLNVWSAKVASGMGFSNKPMVNLTRRILVTASSILLIGITPLLTWPVRMLMKLW